MININDAAEVSVGETGLGDGSLAILDGAQVRVAQAAVDPQPLQA